MSLPLSLLIGVAVAALAYRIGDWWGVAILAIVLGATELIRDHRAYRADEAELEAIRRRLEGWR